MTSSIYSASVPVFKQMLTALSDVLKKAEAHATEKNIDPNALLQARLFPDMFPLVRQVQIAADFAKGISSRLAGVEVPSWPDTEVTFADLQALIAKALAHIGTLDATQFDGSENKEIVLRPGTPKEKKLVGSAYLQNYGLPQFLLPRYDGLRDSAPQRRRDRQARLYGSLTDRRRKGRVNHRAAVASAAPAVRLPCRCSMARLS